MLFSLLLRPWQAVPHTPQAASFLETENHREGGTRSCGLVKSSVRLPFHKDLRTLLCCPPGLAFGLPGLSLPDPWGRIWKEKARLTLQFWLILRAFGHMSRFAQGCSGLSPGRETAEQPLALCTELSRTWHQGAQTSRYLCHKPCSCCSPGRGPETPSPAWRVLLPGPLGERPAASRLF